jgi:hypothetical protein
MNLLKGRSDLMAHWEILSCVLLLAFQCVLRIEASSPSTFSLFSSASHVLTPNLIHMFTPRRRGQGKVTKS